jgi:formate C-acetyltransferase
MEGRYAMALGRMDQYLYPFYKSDIEKGILTKNQAYDLVAKFLVTFDMHYDHDMKMEGYADHELENTYTLGGCDKNGKPFYNELTKMFLTANREEKIGNLS